MDIHQYYLHYDSCHVEHIKRSIVFSETLRLKKMWPKKCDLHSQVKNLKRSICISRRPVLCLVPGPGHRSRPMALVPKLYLPTLAPDLHLPALAPNLCLPALAPNLCLAALGPNFYLLVLSSNLLFSSSDQDFTTTTTTATSTITTTTITTTTTTTTTSTTSTTRDNNNKRCLRGSKTNIKWLFKDIWWKIQVLFQ